MSIYSLLNSYPIITDPYLTEYRSATIKRVFTKRRLGKNKNIVKYYKLPAKIRPSTNIYLINGYIVCHPNVVNQIKALIITGTETTKHAELNL